MQHSLWNMYSCIQNGLLANQKSILCPSNKFCLTVLSVFYKEGYINGFRFFPKKAGMIEIFLKYNNGKPAIQKIVSPSRPGRRVYVSAKTIWKTPSSLVTYILSTPKGVYSDKDCRRFGLGGELIGLLS